MNANAEAAGGLHPLLPSDSATLRSLVDAARASGVDPYRYQTLLKQYWLAVGTESAGIDLASWTPFDGVHANLGNLTNTFQFYERLQLEHRELQWAGMGGMVGPAFAGGLLDLDYGRVVLEVQAISEAMALVWREVDRVGSPITTSMGAPEDIAALLQVGHEIRPEDVMWFQGKVIAMSKHIFSDLIPMHMAWVHDGNGTWPTPNPEDFYDAEKIDLSQTPGGEWVAAHPCGANAKHPSKAKAHADVVRQLLVKIEEANDAES
ncbi:hypothetical protein ABT116_42410 [Streptomyces sp. NPDC002130]|uniref:hypothetical protein n=1 Tax=Streptomyces sp. NPDC002130 TaxID=3155568 RepID=UPI00331DE0E4